MADKTFADGMLFKLPHDGAPDFVKGSVSIKVAEFVAFLQKHEKNSGWVNIDLLVGKSGKPHAALNTYEVEKPDSLKEDTRDEEDLSGTTFDDSVLKSPPDSGYLTFNVGWSS